MQSTSKKMATSIGTKTSAATTEISRGAHHKTINNLLELQRWLRGLALAALSERVFVQFPTSMWQLTTVPGSVPRDLGQTSDLHGHQPLPHCRDIYPGKILIT